MMRRGTLKRTGSAIALGLMFTLASCGGETEDEGDDTPVTAAPTPSPTPSSTPTPSPTGTPTPSASTGNASLTGNLVTETFSAAVARVVFTQGNDAPYANDQIDASVGASGSILVRYDAGAESYTISKGSGGSPFTETFFASDNDSDDGTLVQYYRDGGARISALLLLQPGDTNQLLALRYVTFANYLVLNKGTTTTAAEARALVAGVQTRTLPSSGTFTYAFAIDGYAVNQQRLYRLLGRSAGTITVNFSTGSVRLELPLSGNTDPSGRRTGSNRSFGTFVGTGTITAGTNGFTLDVATPNGQFGAAYGNFYGPSAEEIGLTVAQNGATTVNAVDPATGQSVSTFLDPVFGAAIVGKR